MGYADITDYQMYGNGSIPPDALEQSLEQASDEIDTMTYSRIIGTGFNLLTQFQQLRIKKAVCQHAEFKYQYGDYLAFPLSGYSAGSISLSFKAEQGAGGIQTSANVLNLLKATGLTDRRLC